MDDSGPDLEVEPPSASLAVERRERVGRTDPLKTVPQAWQAGGGHCNFWETQWQAHLTEPRGAGCLVPLFQGMAEQLPPGPMDHRGPAWG